MYVPGKISKPERPLVDIGTGYYAENVSWLEILDTPTAI